MNREKTYVLSDQPISLKLNLHMAGITYPDPHYRMNRWAVPCGYYIFEAVIEGRGVLETSETTYYLEAGDAYLIPQGCKCEYRSVKQDPWKKVWFNVSGELLDSLCSLYSFSGINVFKQIHLKNDFLQALEFVASDRSNSYSNLAVALHGIINKMYIFNQNKQEKLSCSVEAVRIKKFLDSSWMRKISQQELCRLINKSPAQMQRIFKAAWGMSPGQYIQEKRLKMAIQYLENTSFTIRRIAEHVGFSNEYYFANWFKEKTGHAPKSYHRSTESMNLPAESFTSDT